jgi:hypothetical protein
VWRVSSAKSRSAFVSRAGVIDPQPSLATGRFKAFHGEPLAIVAQNKALDWWTERLTGWRR